MAKEKISYVCQSCGSEFSNWMGQCKECKEWNTITEFKVETKTTNKALSIANNARGKNNEWIKSTGKTVKLSEINSNSTNNYFLTGKSEFDRVLGKGILKGSVILLSGDPGAGKSTLLIEVAEYVARKHVVLYVSGEESGDQIKNRALRLKLSCDNINFLQEVEINTIASEIANLNPSLVIIDSLPTLYNSNSTYSSDSKAGIDENTTAITRIAKDNGISFILVGHITKTGEISGPKSLEHKVDTACNIENDHNSDYRIIRSSKNRFGEVNEVGVFNMTSEGMVSVDNPSELFVSDDREDVYGASILTTIEGNRPLLIEIQVLVSQSEFNYPKRLVSGIELNRLNMIIAILNSQGIATLSDQDLFATAVGGLKLSDTGIDLPLALSVISGYTKKCLPSDIASFGEIDLTGRLRPVNRAELRIKEAALRGFKRILIPKKNMPKKTDDFNIEIIGFNKISEVINYLD